MERANDAGPFWAKYTVFQQNPAASLCLECNSLRAKLAVQQSEHCPPRDRAAMVTAFSGVIAQA